MSTVGQATGEPGSAPLRRHSQSTDETALPLELLAMITMPSPVAGISSIMLSQPLFVPPCPTPVYPANCFGRIVYPKPYWGSGPYGSSSAHFVPGTAVCMIRTVLGVRTHVPELRRLRLAGPQLQRWPSHAQR